jgi:hypothetical protein
LSGTVNGSNAIFTVPDGVYVSGSLQVYRNGQLQTQGGSNDFTETTPGSGTFTFVTAPLTGDVITAVYQTTSTPSFVDAASFLIPTIADGDYRLIINLPFGGSINETTTRSTAGTATATFKINTTALGGTANSVSSTQQSQTHSSSNTFVAGDDIVLTISSNSSCVNLSLTIKFTRTI